MRKYEEICILSDGLSEEAVEAAWTEAKSEIEKLGGKIHQDGPLESPTTSRAVRTKSGGQCMQVVFDLDPSKLTALRDRRKLTPSINRTMVIIAPKRIPPRPVDAEGDKPKEDTADVVAE